MARVKVKDENRHALRVTRNVLLKYQTEKEKQPAGEDDCDR